VTAKPHPEGKEPTLNQTQTYFWSKNNIPNVSMVFFLNQTKSHFLQSETFYRNPNEPLAWAPVALVRFTGPRRVNERIGTTMFREENHLDRKTFGKLFSSVWRPNPLYEYRGLVNNSVMLCYIVGTYKTIDFFFVIN